MKWRLQWRNKDTHSISNSEGYTCPNGAIYQDVFIYNKFYIISMLSKLDYIYIKICRHIKQDFNIRIKIYLHVSRFTYTYQSPLISIDQLPLTRIDNQILHRGVRTDIQIRIFPSRSSPTPIASRSNPGGHNFFCNYFFCDNNNNN